MAENDQKGKLTPEQTRNFRIALLPTLGPYAMFMPDEEVQAIRDRMQATLDGPEKELRRERPWLGRFGSSQEKEADND